MDYVISNDGELYHYGVKGMKWGIRRYQNKDGSLTPAGKKRAKQEYKADNKQAFELGKKATIIGGAKARSMKRTYKYEDTVRKLKEKDPEGRKFLTKAMDKRYKASVETTDQLVRAYEKDRVAAERHCKSLVDKYGQEAVSGIKYRSVKVYDGKGGKNYTHVINERTNNLSDYAKAGAESLALSGGLTMLGVPAVAIITPKTTRRKTFELEMGLYGANYQKDRK